MSERLISQRIRMPTKQKSQSISEIQQEQLRISFSILSILQPEDNLESHQKQLKSLTTRQQEQFNREYVQFPKDMKKLKDTMSPAVKYKKTYDQGFNKENQYRGEYFEPTQILTPKMNLNKFHKQLGLQNKSSKKDVSTKRNKSKSRCQSRQKSTKSISSHKKMQKGFNFVTRYQKSPYNFDFKMINSPYSPRVGKSTSKQKIDKRIKSLKEIVIICHQQNLQKPKNHHKNQIQKLSNKENILTQKSVGKNQPKSKHKKNFTNKIKGSTSHKQIPYLSSDYWSYGFDIQTKPKNKEKEQKLRKNSEFKKLKQKINPY